MQKNEQLAGKTWRIFVDHVDPAPALFEARAFFRSLKIFFHRQFDDQWRVVNTAQKKVKADLIMRIEMKHNADLKKLLREVEERLITEMEDREDIAESSKALEEIKSGKVQTIPWEQVKAKHGL